MPNLLLRPSNFLHYDLDTQIRSSASVPLFKVLKPNPKKKRFQSEIPSDRSISPFSFWSEFPSFWRSPRPFYLYQFLFLQENTTFLQSHFQSEQLHKTPPIECIFHPLLIHNKTWYGCMSKTKNPQTFPPSVPVLPS